MVPVERQKIMGFKGGVLKDDAQWKDLDLTEGKNLMMMGTALELEKPTQAVTFIEDLPEQEQDSMLYDLPAGLLNLGNTCYLNATLQCLKNVPELVQTIQKYKQPTQPSLYSGLVKSSQSLFNEMLKSNSPISTYAFLSIFRRLFPQFDESKGGMHLQQDAEEAMSQLMTAYSQELAAPGETLDAKSPHSAIVAKSIIGKLFGVEAKEVYTCKDAPNEEATERMETLLKLTCNINIDTSYLHEGLKKGLLEEISKFSPSLQREAVYNKKTLITKLPPYLNVQFVRFHWKKDVKESRDSATVGVKAKIIRAVQFPFTLDVFDLCTPELKEKLSVKRKIMDDIYNDSSLKRKPEDEEMADAPAEKKPDNTKQAAVSTALDAPIDIKSNDTGKYELTAVLTHQGRFADSGHYVAWVKKEDNVWMKFDDSIVSTHNNEDIKKLFGGGEWHMAYILIYRSVTVDAPATTTTDTKDESSSSSTTTTTTTTSTTQ
ncbi:hypothetical protein SAMD00019534_009360 [Acytostelium subglobosum LB1]|uniref:hypothetical protein n=1 Tax=Acytostelium subglobosum LB1 TaxID=1410327 RepID=UPI000644F84F|nr:hypothetical protein SAMD00019534_009360 [Acytostelium subglobosum LB1]GAM17761.1 hypothetical protein SAMD00019534_009360 [Acytostelium subglobosum LB1]|eukprot:XP_012758357.1 hypothetical protein SAMD00019534_009360 [Acytostelium subglobosum LB1]